MSNELCSVLNYTMIITVKAQTSKLYTILIRQSSLKPRGKKKRDANKMMLDF